MKKFALTLIFLFIFANTVSAAFNDVASGHMYKTAIAYVHDMDIVSGYDDGSYRPDALITRAEFTKIIVNAVYNTTDINNCIALHDFNTEVFPDVQYSHTQAKYICTARVNNVIDGFEDGNFKPDQYITLGQASKILAEAFNMTGSRIELKDYADELIEKKYIPAQLRALNEYITRGQMAEMIYRIKEDNRSKEALKESGLYDQIITLEYYDHENNRDSLTGRIVDNLNYSVFSNNFNQVVTIEIDEKSSRLFLEELEDLDNNDDAKALIYIKDGRVRHGFIFELNGDAVN